MSQREISRLCGISQEAWSKLERGQHQPTAKMLLKICGFLDVCPDSFWMQQLEREKLKRKRESFPSMHSEAI